jgi:hypothetical protein
VIMVGLLAVQERDGDCVGAMVIGDCLLISKAQSDNMEAITTQFLVIYPKRNTCGSSDFILFFCSFFFSYRSTSVFIDIHFFYDPF